MDTASVFTDVTVAEPTQNAQVDLIVSFFAPGADVESAEVQGGRDS